MASTRPTNSRLCRRPRRYSSGVCRSTPSPRARSQNSPLLTTALPSLLPSPSVGTRIGYRLVFPDTRKLGSVILGQGDDYDQEGDPAALGRMHGDVQKTLADARFVIVDYN
ncbi:hypothetical protein E4T44_07911 [Aureobasidium sp. EXF-8845]|nr:hypothetical protein E4T44_07911 [Aureobasidium sp. EXF-8845]